MLDVMRCDGLISPYRCSGGSAEKQGTRDRPAIMDGILLIHSQAVPETHRSLVRRNG